MGSHGGATAEGQRQILEEYGITPGTMGVPVSSSMEVVRYGALEDGTPLYCDKNAWEADVFYARISGIRRDLSHLIRTPVQRVRSFE